MARVEEAISARTQESHQAQVNPLTFQPLEHTNMNINVIDTAENPGAVISNRNRLAEDLARSRRLDKDALINAALLRLETSARDIATDNANTWIAFYATFTGRSIAPEDVPSLIAEIRASLSPLVR
jgi:hypothetical protein